MKAKPNEKSKEYHHFEERNMVVCIPSPMQRSLISSFSSQNPKVYALQVLAPPCLIGDQPNKKALAACILHALVLNKNK